MQAEDVASYLANLLAIVRCDGLVRPEEETAFSAVVSELKARKKDVREAEKLVDRPDFRPYLVGRLSARIRNIEDMALVALADTQISPGEQAILSSVAEQIGLSHEQMAVIMGEARARFETRVDTRMCASCQAQISASAKFCSAKGDQTILTPMGQGPGSCPSSQGRQQLPRAGCLRPLRAARGLS